MTEYNDEIAVIRELLLAHETSMIGLERLRDANAPHDELWKSVLNGCNIERAKHWGAKDGEYVLSTQSSPITQGLLLAIFSKPDLDISAIQSLRVGYPDFFDYDAAVEEGRAGGRGADREQIDLRGVKGLPDLTSLALDLTPYDELHPLAECPKLNQLSIYCWTSFPNLAPLNNTEITDLILIGSEESDGPNLGSLNLVTLRRLELEGFYSGEMNTDLTDLEGMAIESLRLCFVDGYSDLAPLTWLPHLKDLVIGTLAGSLDFSVFAEHKSLETLTLVDWNRGHTLLGLECVENLRAVIWKTSDTQETLPEGIERSFNELRQRGVNISFESLD